MRLFLSILLPLSLLLAACLSQSTAGPWPASYALQDYRATQLGRLHAELEDAHPGKSGFTLLRYGRNAFNTRIGLLNEVEQTIDLQVYIWEPDETGRIFAERLIQAADRGVRVRLLVDDLGFGGSDTALSLLDSHPNIQVRVFNPFLNRGSRLLEAVTDFKRINHRMHNKMLIADNSVAIVGGRNLGDNYFSVNPQTNFRDLDIVTVGPVARSTSAVFDRFWNGNWVVPAGELVDSTTSNPVPLDAFVATIRKEIAEGNYPYLVDQDVEDLTSQLAPLDELYTWAPGDIVWDDPEQAAEGEIGGGELLEGFNAKLDTVQKSLTIESAYFVLGEGGLQRVKELVARGVKVQVLTNSLASNDVLAAHAGHARYRRELIEAGAKLYEMRPDSNIIQKTWVGYSRAGLHTKAYVFDEDSLFIGSFNLDPRSANINTEAGIYAEDPGLAGELLAYMEVGIQPANSYRVELDEDGELVWITEKDGKEVRLYKDPKSTFLQRFLTGFIQLLPIESQL
ncbi:MAG: phospholipase D family protein [Halioglobus sp.]